VRSVSGNDAYLRFPTIRGDRVAFVAEDDVWLAPADGGRAWRLTADSVPVAGTRLSPDGGAVAYTSTRDGAPEVHVVDTEGGAARRLSHWGDAFTRVVGWTRDGRVVASTAAGEPFRGRVWAWAMPLDGGVPERLPYGPVNAVSPGPAGAMLLGVDQSRRAAAAWKRYRGGTAGKLWIDRDGSGEFVRLLGELGSQLEDPDWVGDRVVFLSDHEGWGNVYSVRPDGSDLRRHTDLGESYARAMRTDGRRVVYQRLGELWLLEDLAADTQPRRLDVTLAGPRTARQPRPVSARDCLGDVSADRSGRASAVEVLGTIHWLTSRDGPAPALADQPGVRGRLPRVLGPPHGAGSETAPLVAWVTDAEGDDAIEIRVSDGSDQGRRIGAGQLGRVLEVAASPDGRLLAAASHDGRVLVVDVAGGEVREIDRTGHADASGLSFSPDSAWLAWSHPGEEALRQIRAARVADGTEPALIEVTPLRFIDTDPVFTLDGKHLAFLSTRTFDPVYDEWVFDLSFTGATRPYLVPLAATTPSPFHPEPGGRPSGGPEQHGGDGDSDGAPPQPVTLDADGIEERVTAVPVPTGRASALQAAKEGLLWLETPPAGLLGEDRAGDAADPVRPRLQRYDFAKRKDLTLADQVDGFAVTGDGKRVLVRDEQALRVVPADRRVDPDDEGDRDAVVDVDLRRLRVQVDPSAQWRQMYDEAGRLMRDHFWIEDMGGVDWPAVLERYRPVVERVATRDDLSELLWEVQGELGSSHAYEIPPPPRSEPGRRLGHLGADLARDGDRWRVQRVLPGESSVRGARSPLAAPGVAVRAGDAILAVDGRPVDPERGPSPLLAGAAGVPVELTVEPAGEGEVRRVVVVPLEDERALRYQGWVADRRAVVHAASGGRVGYLHIPDMVASGWAQLHRDLHLEVAREALVVDVRDNNGGHVSELVLEKLARRVQGWDTTRHGPPTTYPTNAPRGPMVAIANEQAGSDGDIVTAGFKQLGLGPVVGTRTWGGVIGIDGRYKLVDGTVVTQPRYSFWFTSLGWGVENYGVDPDVEVPIPPQDWAAGRDPQLDTAVRLALEALERQPAASPPDPATRPSRRPPQLPPRTR